ncbi:MAG: Ig-like domain-containing protein, partial [Candidatus Kaiserbacteria bacterium]|nr:Ig-like domain-containing protein [Candidatus Kaiserbacteria bacterium]
MKLTTISRGFYSLLFSFSVFAFSFFAMASVALAVDFSASFSPSADTVAQDVTTAITISFDRAVYVDTAETAFTGTTLATVVSLHATDAAGDAIPFSASISADNTVITIDPTADLPEGAVYVAITDAYYDSAGNQGDAATATFTVTAPAPTPTVVEDQSA